MCKSADEKFYFVAQIVTDSCDYLKIENNEIEGGDWRDCGFNDESTSRLLERRKLFFNLQVHNLSVLAAIVIFVHHILNHEKNLIALLNDSNCGICLLFDFD